jgi:outer membrane protein
MPAVVNAGLATIVVAATAGLAAPGPAKAADKAVVKPARTAAATAVATARADTLEWALAQAYQNNPQLNAQRAIVRQVDENVPQALSGYRPTLGATATLGTQYTDTLSRTAFGAVRSTSQLTPHTIGVTGQQVLFNGFQTGNRTRAAESQVFAARETLRLLEQTVLLDAATAYMNLLRDSAILDLQRRNVEVLQEGLRQTRDRFNVGEVTRTDVAQSESRIAQGRSQLLTAESNYTTSRAVYRRVIGVDPGRLSPGTPVDRFSPSNLDAAVSQGTSENPNVTAAMYGVDTASLLVRINEGALYPTLTLNGNVTKQYETSAATLEAFQGSLTGQLNVPIYQGGDEYSLVRQAKETLGQKRLDLDTTRDQARATVVQFWGQLQSAKAQIQSTQAGVAAAEIAVNGVREEARVGQRTTLDVLNAQQELVNARVALVTAQRDRVVASYSLLSAVGRLSVDRLALPVSKYDPRIHYHQVRDVWFGVRTPDGR